MNYLRFAWPILLIISLGCEKKTKNLTAGFYHWKSISQNSEDQINYLDKLHIDHLHYRFFDLALEGGTINPVGEAKIDTQLLKKRSFSSCIFITNSCFLTLNKKDTEDLAEKVLTKLTDRIQKLDLKSSWKEIQIDCDWTENSRASYFHFLEQLKAKMPEHISLSATIRLHQIKYASRTGTPPVDKGALMCYNMGDIKDVQEENSIFNSEILESYLPAGIEYGLELDIALPLFEWLLVYRDGKLSKIINETSNTYFDSMEDIQELLLDSDQYFGGHYLYKGDFIRKEAINFKDLEEAATIINNTGLKTSKYLLFYHLNEKVIKKYPHDKLADLCSSIK